MAKAFNDNDSCFKASSCIDAECMVAVMHDDSGQAAPKPVPYRRRTGSIIPRLDGPMLDAALHSSAHSMQCSCSALWLAQGYPTQVAMPKDTKDLYRQLSTRQKLT